MERFLIIGLNHIIEWLLGYRFISGVYTGGYKKIRLLLALGIANAILLISFSDNVAINIFVNFVILYSAVFVSTQKRAISIGFNVFLFEFMIIVAEEISLFIGRKAGMQLATGDMTYQQLFVLTVIDKLLLVALVELLLFILKRVKKEERKYGLANYIIILVSVFSVLILLCLLVIMTGENTDSGSIRLLTISTILILGMNVMIYILNAVIARENRIKSQMAIDLQREKDMDNYIKLLEQKISDERILIHDVKNHFAVIKDCIDKNQVIEAHRYLEELGNDRALHSGYKYTNNSVVNLILARYDSYCKEKGILFYIDSQNGNLDFLNYAEITSLICNLLDNAIESAEKTEKPLVQLKMDYNPDSRTSLISVNNSCDSKPKRKRNGEYVTTKSEGELHGTGQRSVKKIIEKYQGTYSSFYDDELREFIINISLRETGEM